MACGAAREGSDRGASTSNPVLTLDCRTSIPMNKPPILSVLAFFIGVVALATALLRSPGPVPAPRGEVTQGVDPSSYREVLTRLDRLTEDNRVLRDSVAMLENASIAAPRTPVDTDHVTRSDFDTFRDEIRAALEAGAVGATLSAKAKSADFKDEVAGTLREIRGEEARAATEAKHQRRVDRLDKLMPKLEAGLGLTGGQSNDLRAALVSHYDRQAELTRRWQAGEDPDVLGDVKRSDRQTHMAELSAILTPEQLQSFRESGAGGK